MQIQLYPIAGLPGTADDTVSVAGDVITVNGAAFDLSGVPEGGEAAPVGDHPFIGSITRTGGVLHVGLRFTYRPETAVPDQSEDPSSWAVNLSSGSMPDPIARRIAE